MVERYYFQYHSRTIVSLRGRKEQQVLPRPILDFNSENVKLRVALSDSIKKTNDVNLHTGLEIIVYVESDSEDNARKTAKDWTEMILNLVSFSTLAHCNPAVLVSIMNVQDNDPQLFTHYVYPFDLQEIIGLLSVVDEPLFRTIFEAYAKSAHQQRVMRALGWLRKGIGEENVADEFISYWVGLEVIKHILRRHLKTKMRNPSEWAGVEDIFANELHFQNFDAVRENGRHGLLHGFKELNEAFIKEIKGYIEPARKTLVYCIGSVLGLEDSVTLAIADKSPRGIPQSPWQVVKGELTNLPVTFKELVGNYPRIDAQIANKEFSIDQSGNLNPEFKVGLRFRGPSDAWRIKRIELWVDKDAGIGHASMLDMNVIRGTS